MPPNDIRNDATERPEQNPTVENPPRPLSDSTPPTFPPEAESLLQHLKLGAQNPAAPEGVPPPGEFPRLPNYEIEGELGRGGMGLVYKARQTSLNRVVALKMILTSAHAAPSEVTRFLAEAEAIAAVKHPNVVEVYELGDYRGRPYFAMEFVGGGTLAALLKEKGRLPAEVAAELIATVAYGVQAAHDAGIVHRDLKPGNILLRSAEGKPGSSEGQKGPPGSSPSAFPAPRCGLHPKVSDFGLAKRLSSDLTRSQAVMGTPAYMAPEQAGGRAKFVGPAADVYALGVILYECLTGKPPFDSPDAWSLIRQVLEDPPEPPRKLAPGTPRDLELICLKCLEKEPHHRYPTAAALAEDLNRFLRGEPVSVRPIGALARLARYARREPPSAALAALVGLLLLIAPPLAVWQEGRLDRRAADAESASERAATATAAQAVAEKARVSALQLAEARELLALQNKLRTRGAARPADWTRASRAELTRAVALAGDDDERNELRSLAADMLLADDLQPLEPFAKGFTAAALAVDPKSGLIAAGEFKGWGSCRVLLLDPASGLAVRLLVLPTVAIRAGGPLDLVQDGTRSLAFSPDGKRLFVGTRSSRIVRFDLDNPGVAPAKVWKASSGPVEQLAVSPDGKTVYGLCRPEVPIFAWAADTGTPLTQFHPNEAVPILSFEVLPSGELIAGNGHNLYRWKADGGLVRAVENRAFFRLAATHCSMLLVGDGPRLRAYDCENFEPTDQFTDPNLRISAHEEFIGHIAVHPLGAFAATVAGGTERAVKVWELASGRLVGTIRATGTGPIAVAWSRDGNELLVTMDRELARWRLMRAEPQRFACGSAFTLDAATFLPGGRVAALSRDVRWRRELLVGKPAEKPQRGVVSDRGGDGRPGLTSSPGGLIAAAILERGIVLWKPEAGAPSLELPKHFAGSPRFSPDGRTLWAITNSKEVRAFDPVTKAQRAYWSNELATALTGLASLDTLAVGQDGAAVGGRDGSVYVLNAECEVVASLPNAGDPVLAVALTPDQAIIAAGTQKGLLRLIRPATKTELAPTPAHSGGTTAVAVNRDGSLLATGGRDRVVRLWKRTGDRFEPLFTVSDLPGAVRELQFSASDGRLLVLLTNAHAVRVWDTDRLRAQLAELKLGW